MSKTLIFAQLFLEKVLIFSKKDRVLSHKSYKYLSTNHAFNG
jgi:hypothetical protein